MNFITDKSPTFYLERAKSRLIEAIDNIHLGWSIFSIDDYYDYTDYVLIPFRNRYVGELLRLDLLIPTGNEGLSYEDEKAKSDLILLESQWDDIIKKGTFLPISMKTEYDLVHKQIKIRLTYDKKVYYKERAAYDVQAILDEKV